MYLFSDIMQTEDIFFKKKSVFLIPIQIICFKNPWPKLWQNTKQWYFIATLLSNHCSSLPEHSPGISKSTLSSKLICDLNQSSQHFFLKCPEVSTLLLSSPTGIFLLFHFYLKYSIVIHSSICSLTFSVSLSFDSILSTSTYSSVLVFLSTKLTLSFYLCSHSIFWQAES